MATHATPKPGTVRDVRGQLCPAATAADYPLYAECDLCATGIRCADGTAAWCHVRDYQAACSP